MASAWLRLENHLHRQLATETVQRAWSSSWLGRWAARWHAARLFRMQTGFCDSQILLACEQTGLLHMLLEKPGTPVGVLADALSLTEVRLRALLLAAESAGLLKTRSDAVRLKPLGAAVVGNATARSMLRHNRLLYSDLAQPAAMIQQGAGDSLSSFWSYAGNDALSQETYSELMQTSQALVADQVLASVAFRPGETVLDVGGGTGALLRRIQAKQPNVEPWLFDLPAVCELGSQRNDGIQRFPGSFLDDALPTGADTVTLLRVAHDHDDDRFAQLLERVHACLPDGGRLVLAEPMAGDGAERYFACYFLAMGQGRVRTPAELMAMIESAGFRRVRQRQSPLPLVARVIEAFR